MKSDIMLKRKIRQVYDKINHSINLQCGDKFRLFFNYEMALFLEYLDVRYGDIVLDMGCGTGRFFPFLNKKGALVIGCDFSKNMALLAKKYTRGVYDIIICDCAYLPFKEQVFDKVLACGLFEYVQSLREYLREVDRVLKKGGRIVFNVWNALCPFIPLIKIFEFRHYPRSSHTPACIRGVMKSCNLRIINISGYFFLPFLVLGHLPNRFYYLIIKIEKCTSHRKLYKFASQIIVKAENA